MKTQKYTVELSKSERDSLQKIIKSRSKKVSEERKTRSKIILSLDESDNKSLTPEQTAKKCKVHRESVYRVRKEFISEGIDRVIFRKKRETPPVEPKITGELEAHIIAAACSAAPDGKSRWTLQMIANKMILEGYVDYISDVSIMNTLKKHNLSLI
jgi:mRNA-degrading endonuclease RelE of RelBE toxin-antitoxin system